MTAESYHEIMFSSGRNCQNALQLAVLFCITTKDEHNYYCSTILPAFEISYILESSCYDKY